MYQAARDVVTPDAQDSIYEAELLRSDPDYEGSEGAGGRPPLEEPVTTPALASSEVESNPPLEEAVSDTEVVAWMRPDRINFDGIQAPFVVPDGDDVTWYKIGEEEGGATTRAAQQIKEITDYQGEVVTATIGGELSCDSCLMYIVKSLINNKCQML